MSKECLEILRCETELGRADEVGLVAARRKGLGRKGGNEGEKKKKKKKNRSGVAAEVVDPLKLRRQVERANKLG